MGNYSQTFGSFIRNGNYPLEAEYIFNSVEELKEWTSEPQNQGILHDGLLKIVKDTYTEKVKDKKNHEIEEVEKENQVLYWCYNKEFYPLCDLRTFSNLERLYNFIGQAETITDFIKDIDRKLGRNIKDIQQELNLTQLSIGLDASGAFDPTHLSKSNYLDSARSIMQCLSILDKTIADSLNDLAMDAFVQNAEYNSSEEELVFTFITKKGPQEVRIGVRSLIEEWEVYNPDSKVVELSRDRSVRGIDKLSADVRIVNNKNNILEKTNEGLIVKGTSDNIIHDGKTLDKVLEEIGKGSSQNVFDYYSDAVNANLKVGEYFLTLNDEKVLTPITRTNSIANEYTDSNTYKLVSENSEIKENETYILVYENYAMSQQDSNNTYRTFEEVNVNDPNIIIPSENTTIQNITCIRGTSGFYLKVGEDQYLTINGDSASQNYLRTKSFENASEWTFNVNSDLSFSITASYNDATKFLQFNASKGSERFSCYRTGSQKNVKVYVLQKIDNDPIPEEQVLYPKGVYIVTDYGIEHIPYYENVKQLINKETQNRISGQTELKNRINTLDTNISDINVLINNINSWYEAD